MKLLVTGGAGFIGSAVGKGHEVVNLDALTYAACLENVATVAQSLLYRFEKVDIRDAAAVEDILISAYPTPAQRLHYLRLDNAATAAVFGIKRSEWRKGLRNILPEFGALKA